MNQLLQATALFSIAISYGTKWACRDGQVCAGPMRGVKRITSTETLVMQ
jgi:hypothetical protein